MKTALSVLAIIIVVVGLELQQKGFGLDHCFSTFSHYYSLKEPL